VDRRHWRHGRDLHATDANRKGQAHPADRQSLQIQMATIGHWKNGVMDEEYLFWDNQEFMKQIGLGK